MSEKRIIKKYPNRRLYDTAISKYVTLESIKQLVVAKAPIQVIDLKTREDVTRATLLQIIFDEESKGMQLFTTEIMQHFIGLYDGAMRVTMRQLLEQSIAFFDQDRATHTVEWQDLVKDLEKAN